MKLTLKVTQAKDLQIVIDTHEPSLLASMGTRQESVAWRFNTLPFMKTAGNAFGLTDV